jgi:hypothetical protein
VLSIVTVSTPENPVGRSHVERGIPAALDAIATDVHVLYERKARFRYNGAVRGDRHHTLCFQCYRSAVNRLRSRVLVWGAYA